MHKYRQNKFSREGFSNQKKIAESEFGNSKPELLLPAGSREAFAAAIEGGADAVYLGLEKFNARNRAKNFHVEDLQPLVEIAHQNQVKVYLTLNTLIKNAEIRQLLEIVQYLNSYPPDAIIVQDWGVFNLIHKLSRIPLHGSTQMGLHNSVGAQFSKRAGLERIIMARELTFPELQEIRHLSQIDLELFVHGALCYSFSGGCLFSSYAGGMSANRGLCKQPCRRLYSSESSEKYWFNLKDLQLIEMIPQLMKIGIHALKIEGRMKRADYVYSAAKAYRMVIDHPEQLAEAKIILNEGLNRERTAYFMQSPLANNIAEFPFTGLPIGYVAELSKDKISFKLSQSIHPGDTLRILPSSGEDRPSFPASMMEVDGKKVEIAKSEEIVSLPIPEGKYSVGNTVFLTDKSSFKPKLKIPYRKPIHLKPLSPQFRQVMEQMCKIRNFITKQGLYFRIDDKDWFDYLQTINCEEIFVPLSILEDANIPSCYSKNQTRIELPRFIQEKALHSIKSQLQALVNDGYRKFLISHISQMLLFSELSKLDIMANEWVYCMNDAAINFYADQDVKGFIYPLENDIPNLMHYRNKGGIVPLFFHPQLFYSRQPVHLKQKFSDADRQYQVLTRKGWTFVIPQEAVSVFQYRNKIEEYGYSRFLIDLSFMEPNKDELSEIVDSYQQGLKWKNSSTFNYKKGLW